MRARMKRRLAPLLPSLIQLTVAGCGSGGSGGGGNGVDSPPGPAWPGKAGTIAVSFLDTCAVATNGAGYCWGTNASWQLTWPHVIPTVADPFDPCSADSGGSSTKDWPCVGRAPVPVTGGESWKVLTYSSAGPLCGVTAAGVVKCYENATADAARVDYPAGVTTMGSLPICGGIPCLEVPLPLKGGGTYSSFGWGFGMNFGCGLTAAGAVNCLGGNSQYGVLGSGTLGETILVPRPVAGAQSFTMISVAFTGNHVCGLIADGSAYCWGADDAGQVGVTLGSVPDALPNGVPHPVAVAGGQHFKWISAGANQTCAIDMAGAAYCWGQGAYGSFGNGTVEFSTAAPTAIAAGQTFDRIEVGSGIACAVDTAGDGWCWGSNSYGNLGLGSIGGTVVTTPTKVLGGLSWKTIVPGLDHTCGITTNDEAYCWGRNAEGQLGAPSLWVGATAANSPVPVAVGR
jgi:alpha-tubulin suppressor-like RCC1 family protein